MLPMRRPPPLTVSVWGWGWGVASTAESWSASERFEWSHSKHQRRKIALCLLHPRNTLFNCVGIGFIVTVQQDLDNSSNLVLGSYTEVGPLVIWTHPTGLRSRAQVRILHLKMTWISENLHTHVPTRHVLFTFHTFTEWKRYHWPFVAS